MLEQGWSAALLLLLVGTQVYGSSRHLLQTPTIASFGPCPDGISPSGSGTIMDALTPGLAVMRGRHGAGRLRPDPTLVQRSMQALLESRACASTSHPAPTYNSSEGLLGVGFAAVGNPLAKSYKCIQNLNQWYGASASFDFLSATPYSANNLPGDVSRTSDNLALTAMLWNSTDSYGCAMAVCSDNFHTEMFCLFRDSTGALPLLLENHAAANGGDSSLQQELNSLMDANLAPAAGPCPMPYTTRTGDTLQSIAQQFNITPAELVCFNRQVGATVQIGLGTIPLLIPCPRMARPFCPEWDFINGTGPSAMMQTPMDDMGVAAARFNLTANDVCCYNPFYNLSLPAGGTCGAPPLFNGTLSWFMIPSKQEMQDRNCKATNVLAAQQPGTPLECYDKAMTVQMFNMYRSRFFLKPVKWDDSLTVQAKELASNSDLCNKPLDPRVSVSIGSAGFSGAARPQCALTPAGLWGTFEQAASLLGLWNVADAFVDQVPEVFRVMTKFFPKNTTTAMGCALLFCGPYWTYTTCVFRKDDEPTAPASTNSSGPANTAGRRLYLQELEELGDAIAMPMSPARGRAMQAMTGPRPAVQLPPQSASCPTAIVPSMGDTLESFAAKYNNTPRDITCFANQLRNLNDEFRTYWLLGVPVIIPCPGYFADNASCPEWDLAQGKCGIPYLVYPGDNHINVAQLVNRLNNTQNMTASELCCYNKGMDSVINGTCAFNNVGQNITIPCRPQLVSSGCTATDIQAAFAALAGPSESSSSPLGLILGLAIGIPVGLALLGLLAFLLYRRTKATKAASSSGGSYKLSDPLSKSMDLEEDITKGKYDIEADSNLETSNSIIMFGKQRTGALSGVVLKFFKNEDAFRHERLFYTDFSNPQFFPECYDARPVCKDHLPCVVIERGDTSLRQWIKQGGNSNMGARTKAHVKAILADIGDGLKSLHSRGLIHGDVKPENVLFFTRSHRWKLIDFGTWSKADEELVPAYSLRYSAPEVVAAAINGKPAPSKPAQDMWSLGMVMWECLVGEHMLAEYKDAQVTAMLTGQSPMPFEDDPSLWQVIKEEPARRLLHALLQRKPNFRWDVNRVLENAFFREGEDTVMTYRKFQALNETQGAVLNKLDEVATKVSLLQPFPLEKLTEQPQSAIMICCTLEELSDADTHLLFDSDASVITESAHGQQGKESAGEHYKLQEKDPMVRLRQLVNDNVISATEVPILDVAGPEAASLAPGEQIFMLKKNTKYLIKMKLAMCDSQVLSVQTVASMSITPVSHPNDSVMVPMHALESGCSPTQLVAFGLWDPSEHSSQVFTVTGTPIPVEAALCMYTKAADIPIVVKPVAMMMMNNTQAELNAQLPTHNHGGQDRWDSAPQWVKAAAVGVQWFYQL